MARGKYNCSQFQFFNHKVPFVILFSAIKEAIFWQYSNAKLTV